MNNQATISKTNSGKKNPIRKTNKKGGAKKKHTALQQASTLAKEVQTMALEKIFNARGDRRLASELRRERHDREPSDKELLSVNRRSVTDYGVPFELESILSGMFDRGDFTGHHEELDLSDSRPHSIMGPIRKGRWLGGYRCQIASERGSINTLLTVANVGSFLLIIGMRMSEIMFSLIPGNARMGSIYNNMAAEGHRIDKGEREELDAYRRFVGRSVDGLRESLGKFHESLTRHTQIVLTQAMRVCPLKGNLESKKFDGSDAFSGHISLLKSFTETGRPLRSQKVFLNITKIIARHAIDEIAKSIGARLMHDLNPSLQDVINTRFENLDLIMAIEKLKKGTTTLYKRFCDHFIAYYSGPDLFEFIAHLPSIESRLLESDTVDGIHHKLDIKWLFAKSASISALNYLERAVVKMNSKITRRVIEISTAVPQEGINWEVGIDFDSMDEKFWLLQELCFTDQHQHKKITNLCNRYLDFLGRYGQTTQGLSTSKRERLLRLLTSANYQSEVIVDTLVNDSSGKLLNAKIVLSRVIESQQFAGFVEIWAQLPTSGEFREFPVNNFVGYRSKSRCGNKKTAIYPFFMSNARFWSIEFADFLQTQDGLGVAPKRPKKIIEWFLSPEKKRGRLRSALAPQNQFASVIKEKKSREESGNQPRPKRVKIDSNSQPEENVLSIELPIRELEEISKPIDHRTIEPMISEISRKLRDDGYGWNSFAEYGWKWLKYPDLHSVIMDWVYASKKNELDNSKNLLISTYAKGRRKAVIEEASNFWTEAQIQNRFFDAETASPKKLIEFLRVIYDDYLDAPTLKPFDYNTYGYLLSIDSLERVLRSIKRNSDDSLEIDSLIYRLRIERNYRDN